jgi:CheY-like chemotaxis protein
MALILLVEDNPGVLAATSLVLKNAGHRVTTATSVAEAAACTRTNPDLDLVITDYRLSGADAVKRMRCGSQLGTSGARC